MVTVGIDRKVTKKVHLMGLGDQLDMQRKRSHKCLSWENKWTVASTRQEKRMRSRLGRERSRGVVLRCNAFDIML